MQIFVVETIVTAICDEFAEQLRRNHRHVLIFVCLLFYAAGLVLCTQVTYPCCNVNILLQGGMYIMQLLDYFAASWSLLIIGFCECIVIAWVYGKCHRLHKTIIITGVDNLMDNIKWMVRFYPAPYILWKLMWKMVTPFIIMVLPTHQYSTPNTVHSNLHLVRLHARVVQRSHSPPMGKQHWLGYLIHQCIGHPNHCTDQDMPPSWGLCAGTVLLYFIFIIIYYIILYLYLLLWDIMGRMDVTEIVVAEIT